LYREHSLSDFDQCGLRPMGEITDRVSALVDWIQDFGSNHSVRMVG